MPVSAVNGLVEGLLQGHAIAEQKRRDAEEKNRQHAQDVAAYHIQDWKEKQAAELAKQSAAQQAFDNNLATQRQKNAEAEEARKQQADKDRNLLSSSKVASALQKPYADFVKEYFKAGGTDPEQARQFYLQMNGGPMPGALPPGSVDTPSSLTPGPQQAPPGVQIPGMQQPPIVPRGFDTPGNPAFGQQAPIAPPQNPLNPKAAAGIAKTQADTAKAEAMIPKIKADTVYAGFHSDWMKMRVDTEKETAKLRQGQTDLTHAATAYKEAMTKIDGDLKKADTMLAEARTTEAIARTEYTHEQIQHTKNMDALKSSSVDLNTETKKANLREKAMKQEGSIARDRRKQEDAIGKMQATLNTYNVIAKIDKSKLDPADPKNTPIMVQIDTAKAQIPYLQQRIAETKDRIDLFTKDEKEAHAYVAQTTEMLNKSGTVNKPATEKNRATADKAAKNPPKLPAIPAPGAKSGRLRTVPSKQDDPLGIK